MLHAGVWEALLNDNYSSVVVPFDGYEMLDFTVLKSGEAVHLQVEILFLVADIGNPYANRELLKCVVVDEAIVVNRDVIFDGAQHER